MSSVLVTDGDQRAALAFARSIGAAGGKVVVASSDPPSLAGSSRYVRAELRVPDPLSSPADYAEAMSGLVRRSRPEILLPISDASLSALLPRRELFSGVTIPVPDWDAYRAVSDKRQVAERARSLGIRVPHEELVRAPGDDSDARAGAVGYPLVVKPTRSVADAGDRLVKTSVGYARDASQLRSVLSDLPAAAFPVLLQERVEGPGKGVFLLLWDGELLAAFAHRRLREKPPSGGVSVLRESVSLAADLRDRSRTLLDAVGWRGVAMVEYKEDAASGEPVLMEVNGRFWGSLQLAIDSGVDFPRILVRAARGEAVQPVLDYRTGVRSRWFWGDVDHLLLRMRHSRDSLDLPADAPGRLAILVDFLRAFRPGTRSEVFRWSDPGPALRESIGWLRRLRS